MGQFSSYLGSLYILLVVDYMSKWIDVKATQTNEAKVVLNFVRTHIFDRFRTLKTVISDHNTYFCNHSIEVSLHKYHVTHQTFIAYHP